MTTTKAKAQATIDRIKRLPWRQQLYRLAVKKAALDDEKEKLQQLQWAFNAQHADLIKRIEALKEVTTELEKDVREAALAEFLETGDKDPAPGVKLKRAPTISYDEDTALEYCREYAPDLLKLDSKAFERRAKELAKKDKGLRFVEIDDEAHGVTLAKSLPLKAEMYDEAI